MPAFRDDMLSSIVHVRRLWQTPVRRQIRAGRAGFGRWIGTVAMALLAMLGK